MESTIFETFVLPSKGKIYDKAVNPTITLRSMTVIEEMKRLSPTDMPYKLMSDIIEDCMGEKPAIHVYDMCLGDYQYLLHKIRIVTYGSDYRMTVQCPNCNEITESVADLESLEVHEWDDSYIEKKIITLPITKHQIELKFQTPHSLDLIAYKTKEMKKKTKQNLDYSIIFTLISLIKKVDGREMNSLEMEEFVKGLPNRDANYLINKSSELSELIGLDNNISVKCVSCGKEMVLPFRITSEFFGPKD